MSWVQIPFWLSVAAILHSYILYPYYVIRLARNIPEPLPPPSPSVDLLPRVAVLIAAYNGEKSIAARIANILSCHYPSDRLRVVIASDGSTDQTVKIASESPAANVEILDFLDRQGKAATLVRAMAELDDDVVILTDATTHFLPDAILKLARHFSDPSVGIVSGKVNMLTGSGLCSEGFYWRMETKIRVAEARLGVLTGVSGAIYAIRRSLFVAPQYPTINDDMVFPILAKHKHNCRYVFDQEAIAEVLVVEGINQEFSRRRRIGRGAFHSLRVLWPAMLPKNGLSAIALISHKLLRWIGPFLMLVCLITNSLLIGNRFYALLLAIQILVLISAIIGWLFPSHKGWRRYCRIATSFHSMNLALGLGFLDSFSPMQPMSWEPTARPLRSGRLMGVSNSLLLHSLDSDHSFR